MWPPTCSSSTKACPHTGQLIVVAEAADEDTCIEDEDTCIADEDGRAEGTGDAALKNRDLKPKARPAERSIRSSKRLASVSAF